MYLVLSFALLLVRLIWLLLKNFALASTGPGHMYRYLCRYTNVENAKIPKRNVCMPNGCS